MRKSILLISLLLIALCFNEKALAENSCHSLFQYPNESLEKLSQKFNTSLKVIFKKESEDDIIEDYVIRIMDSQDVYGVATFAYFHETDTLEIIQMKIYSPYKNKGVGSYLLEHVIRELPKTKYIQSHGMSDDNQAVVNRYIRRGYTQIAAIQQTPAYKMRARLGFTEILPESTSFNDGFTVRKAQD